VPQAVLGLVGLLILVLLVEILPRIGVLPREYFPPSSEIGSALERLSNGETSMVGVVFDWPE